MSDHVESKIVKSGKTPHGDDHHHRGLERRRLQYEHRGGKQAAQEKEEAFGDDQLRAGEIGHVEDDITGRGSMKEFSARQRAQLHRA